MFFIDPETGQILETNNAAGNLLSQSDSELLDMSLRDIFPPSARYDGIIETLHDRASEQEGLVPIGEVAEEGDFEIQRPDGTTVPVKIMASLMTVEGQAVLITVARDISERRSREQRLAVFTRILRHNLRNDLNAVRGYAELLAEEADESRQEMAETLLSMTEDLLDLAGKVQSVENVVGRDEVTIEEIQVADTVQRIADQVESAFAESTVEVDAFAGASLTTVPEPFEVAIENVVENAVKHAETQSPRATVSVSSLSDGVEVVVKDEGPGLPAQEQSVLLRGEETPLEHSSGLGLWLVNWAVGAVEGDIFFEEAEQGSRVILWFPELET